MRIRANGEGPRFEGNVTVIGLGGMFIRTQNIEPAGAVRELMLEDAEATFQCECTIRHVAQNGVGVEITKIAPEDEQQLRTLLLRLKV